MKSLILKLFLFSLLFIKGGDVFAIGDTYVSGYVNDFWTLEPIEGVAVRVLGTTIATTTNSDGIYVLPFYFPGTFTLEFSFVGYGRCQIKNVVVPFNGGVIIKNVTLVPESWEEAYSSNKKLLLQENNIQKLLAYLKNEESLLILS